MRDGLRKPGEKLDEATPDQTWLPPVLQAFYASRGWECDKQTFDGTAVRLAPRNSKDIQLVFEPELAVGAQTAKWLTEFPYTADRRKNDDGEWVPRGVRWPKPPSETKPLGETFPWLEAGESKCLGVDLGLTNGAALQVLHAVAGDRPAEPKGLRHRLNPDSLNPAWFVRSIASSIVRVSGEDRWVWREITSDETAKLIAELKKPKDKRSGFCRKFSSLNEGVDLAYATHAFLPELSGSAGRNALPSEITEAERLFSELKGHGYDIDERCRTWKTMRSFPEQNDDLLWGLKRVRGQLFRLNRWGIQLNQKPTAKSYEAAIENISNSQADDPLHELTALANKPDELRKRIEELWQDYRSSLVKLLPMIADRILRVRRGHWAWHAREDGWHEIRLDKARTRSNALLAGQRGVSIARLAQLRDLRQLAQSLNHLCRHKVDDRYQIRRDDVVPEPFESCRQAMEDAREDRAKQSAHEIFAAALGVELAPPPKDKWERKRTESLHGVYRCLKRGPVNFIALEDLVGYRTSGRQGRRENRQLAAWAHRRVHKVLSELCEMVGMPIVLVPPGLTSHFSAKDHSAGFRAEEIRKDDPRRTFWSKNAKEETGCWSSEFISLLDAIPQGKTLLLPKHGGEVFVSLHGTVEGQPDAVLFPADLSSAYRIGLRALAHPERADATTQIWVSVPRARRDNTAATSANKNALHVVDVFGVLPGSALQAGCPFHVVPQWRSEQVWERVYEDSAWQRCRDINIARLTKWGIPIPNVLPANSPDEEDNVQM